MANIRRRLRDLGVNSNRARLKALGAAALFSTGGAAVKMAAFSAAQIASFRAGIAAIALLLWLRGRVTLSRQAWAVGVVYACMTVLYVAATKLTTSANAIFLQSTGPLYLLLLGPWVLQEKIRRTDLAYLAALAVGLTICFTGRPVASATAPDPATGNVLGLLCGVAWAITLLSLRRVERDALVPGVAVASVIAGCVIASAVTLPFALPVPSAPPTAWAVLVYLGVIQIGLAYVWVTDAVRVLPAFEMSLLLLLEPVLNPIWTWLVWGEYPGALVLSGGAVIVAATAVKSVYDARRPALATHGHKESVNHKEHDEH
jgi:drug/metabolite transporter (DMT)-like permease